MSSIRAVDREARRELLLELDDGPNALDHVEVLGDAELHLQSTQPPVDWRQRMLRVFFLGKVGDDLAADQFRITGGAQPAEVQVGWAVAWSLLDEFLGFVDAENLSADDLAESHTRVQSFADHLLAGNYHTRGHDEPGPLEIDWPQFLADGDNLAAFTRRWRRRLEMAEFRLAVTTDSLWEQRQSGLPPEEQPWTVRPAEGGERAVVVWTRQRGGGSTYRLRLVSRTYDERMRPPEGYDPVLSELALFFKIGCEPDVDCRPSESEAGEPTDELLINYLARDYDSFRKLMLDRLSVTMPQWRDRNPADVGMALVEVMAYAADQLTYYQDAVATEAYLGTARMRTSVRRHARLVDYVVHEGAAARAFVHLSVSDDEGDAYIEPAKPWHPEGVEGPPIRFFTQTVGATAGLDEEAFEALLDYEDPQVYELLEPAYLNEHHNEIAVHEWGDPNFALQVGATSAALRVGTTATGVEQPVALIAGDLLVLEQVDDPHMGGVADPSKRQVVRLTRVYPPAIVEDDGTRTAPADSDYETDPVTGARLVEVEWATEDALTVELPVASRVAGGEQSGLTVARANMVAADHGRTVFGELLDDIDRRPYRPALESGPVSQVAPPPDPAAAKPARRLADFAPHQVDPAVRLSEEGRRAFGWEPRPDLLESGSLDRQFVVEPDSEGRAKIRFGDGRNGRQPVEGRRLWATYRVGNGQAGNVPAEAIGHAVGLPVGVSRVVNPVAAFGGVEPESLEQVRQRAPQVFRRQERAVTEEDYAEVTERHPEVQRAVASRRWTGSWYTMFVSVDRVGGRPVDLAFEQRLVEFLEQFRLAGDDLEIEPPRTVPVELSMSVCLEPGYFRSDVERALVRRFSNDQFADGTRGFFHPDRFTFGQPLYRSEVIAQAMGVGGVRWVELDTFQRRFGRGDAAGEPLEQIAVGRGEVIQLDNDPNHPDRGSIHFAFEGGR